MPTSSAMKSSNTSKAASGRLTSVKPSKSTNPEAKENAPTARPVATVKARATAAARPVPAVKARTTATARPAATASAAEPRKPSAPAGAAARRAPAAAAERRPLMRGRGALRARGLATVGGPPTFTGAGDARELHPAVVKNARRSGQLNLSDKELATVPEKVWHINEIDNEEAKQLTMTMEGDERWWDQVPLTKLLLCGNLLTSLPEQLGLLTHLQTLDLHDNKLTQLPAEISQLQQLSRLVVSHNQLQQLPAVTSLRQLLADHNQLTELPEQLGDCLDLEQMDVSYNQLRALPAGLGYLHRLTRLAASDNQLETVPHELGSMTSAGYQGGGLRQLDLSRNRLQQLPAALGQLAQLETLDVRQNQLQQLPELSSCLALKELHAGYNQIQEVSADVLESLQPLVILDLSNNKLEAMPDEVVCLQRMERLDLRNNSLTVAPVRLCLLPLLKSLLLEGNAVRSLRGDLLRGGTQQLLRHFRERLKGQAKVDGVDIPGLAAEQTAATEDAGSDTQSRLHQVHKVSELPPGSDTQSRLHQVHKMKGSRLCAYSGQKATEVPSDLLEMAAEAEVTTVDVSQNLLTAVPDGLMQLRGHLAELNLSNNRLQELPSDLAQCCHLTFLNVSGNQLRALPDSLAGLRYLREVALQVNRFSAVPPVLYQVASLEILLISDNQVEEIPWKPLRGLPRLATLDLRNNSIPHVPAQLGTVSQLRALHLEGNTFKQPRPSVLAQGTASVLQYLRDRIPMAERET